MVVRAWLVVVMKLIHGGRTGEHRCIICIQVEIAVTDGYEVDVIYKNYEEKRA